MRAYIAHGEADQAIADELKEYLKPLGLFAETESGARGFRHLQHSDVVIALWSRNALFTPYRMMLEKRMLDAWADGQLVLVKLDHNFLPVGMRDLPYIDATFEAARKMTAWRDVARQAKETINRLLVEKQKAAAAPPPARAGASEDEIRRRLSELSAEHNEVNESLSSPEAQERIAKLRQVKREMAASRSVGAAPVPSHAKSGSNHFLLISAVLLSIALVLVGGNVLLQRLNEEPEVAGETVDEPVEVASTQDMRVDAEFLTLLQNADLTNGAAEAAKCQMCHSFDAGGPVLLGPPLYDLIGRDIASHEGFPYSAGGEGLADAEGVWTYRNLNQFLERPKSIAENTTMFFAGIPRANARADLIAYMRTLTPGEPQPLPEALPPGVSVSDSEAGAATEAEEPDAAEDAPETAAGGAMRRLQEASDSVQGQPLLLAGAALVLCALLIFIVRMTRGAPAAPSKKAAAVSDVEAPAEPDLNMAASQIAGLEDEVEDLSVFISYAHDDNDKVEPVVNIVRSNGREVWIDKGGIQAGDGWAGEIVRAIKSAGGVMVMCSQRAFESDHIKREIYLADRYKKPMLPIFLEPAQPPEDFEYFFAGVQWLELFKLPEADRAGAIGRALASV